MKTQVRMRSCVLQTVQATPQALVLMLEKHFHTGWAQLTSLGINLNPPRPTPGQLREQCTEPNGTVWGTRFFDVLPPGYLVSPTSKWVWETAEQVVPEFSNAKAVRSHHGFHAAWTDLQDWIGSKVDHRETMCKALVLGHGDIILGDVGWRSSKMTVVRAAVRFTTDNPENGITANLQRRYPSVVFQDYSGHFTTRIEFDFTTRIEFDFPSFWLDRPSDVKKLEKWVRDQTLSKLRNEFA